MDAHEMFTRTMADLNPVRECARPVSPVTMRPALSSVSVSHDNHPPKPSS